MRFSIIIPTYNTNIQRALNSIQNQTFKDYEIIVIDDYSDIPVENAIRNETNIGAGLSRQKGIDVAKGEYLIFVDADDELNNPNVLEKYNEVIIYDNPDRIKTKYLQIRKTDIQQLTISKAFWSGAYKRQFINDTGIKIQPFKLYEDTLWNNMLLEFNPKTIEADFISYNHYINPKGITESCDHRKDQLWWAIRAGIHYFQFFINSKPNSAYYRNIRDFTYFYYLYEGLRIDNRFTQEEILDLHALFKEWESVTGILKLLEQDINYCNFFYSIMNDGLKSALEYVPRYIEETGFINFYSEILGRKWTPIINKR